MNYRERVLLELESALKDEYLVSVYKWEDLKCLLVGAVREINDTHFKLDNVSPDAEWEDDVDTIAIDQVYRIDSGNSYLNHLTTALERSDELNAPIGTTKVKSLAKKRAALQQICGGDDVARVSLKSHGRLDVLIYEVGEDYIEYATIHDGGEVESGSSILPLKDVKWVQIGSRSQEIVKLAMKLRG